MRTPTPLAAPNEPLDLARGIRRDTLRRRHLALSMFRRSAASDPPTTWIIGEALDLARTYLATDRCAHASRKFGEEVFLLTDGRGWDAGMIGTACLGGDSGSLGGYALELGRPLVVEDLRYFPRFRAEPVLVDTGTKGVMLTAVSGQGAASGLLAVFSASRRVFSRMRRSFSPGWRTG